MWYNTRKPKADSNLSDALPERAGTNASDRTALAMFVQRVGFHNSGHAMSKQRGFGLIELAIWAALAAAITFGVHQAWEGFKERISAPYVAEQKAADKVFIDIAETMAQHAQADTKVLRDAAALQNKALADSEALTQAAQDAARAANIKYAALVAKGSQRASKLTEAATTPVPVGRSCDVVLGATDSVLRESWRSFVETSP